METTEQVKNVQMQLESPEQFIGLFGIREENLPLFKDELNVELFIHGNEVTLSGAPGRVDLAQRTLEALCDILRRGESIDRTRIRYAISLVTQISSPMRLSSSLAMDRPRPLPLPLWALSTL